MCFCSLCDRPSTCVTGDGDIVIMRAAVIAPAVVLTVCDTGLGSIATNVVQPNLSTAGTVTATNKLTAVSVVKHE